MRKLCWYSDFYGRCFCVINCLWTRWSLKNLLKCSTNLKRIYDKCYAFKTFLNFSISKTSSVLCLWGCNLCKLIKLRWGPDPSTKYPGLALAPAKLYLFVINATMLYIFRQIRSDFHRMKRFHESVSYTNVSAKPWTEKRPSALPHK